jgi:nucleotide-binding universal stress UspA family protein
MTYTEAPKPGKIVVGIDGSPASLEALRWAMRQATLTGSRLEVVVTWEWPQSYGWAPPYPSDYSPSADARKTLEEAVVEVGAAFPDVRTDLTVVEGHPAPALVEASKGADLLVVGSRGHGEFAGMLIGSVSEHCTAIAKCPVVVVRTTR